MSLAMTLNLKQIKSHTEKISDIKFFINQYNWEGIYFPSQKKRLEKVWSK